MTPPPKLFPMLLSHLQNHLIIPFFNKNIENKQESTQNVRERNGFIEFNLFWRARVWERDGKKRVGIVIIIVTMFGWLRAHRVLKMFVTRTKEIHCSGSQILKLDNASLYPFPSIYQQTGDLFRSSLMQPSHIPKFYDSFPFSILSRTTGQIILAVYLQY